MPVLSNAKHEIFAQSIASGKKLDAAALDAGFKVKGKGNSWRLRKRPEVEGRIAEILEQRSDIAQEVIVKQIEVTRDTLLAELEEAREIAKNANQSNGMVMATIGKARITGNIIDRREVGNVGDFDGHTDAELVAEAAKRAKELGIEGPKLVAGVSQADDET